MSSELKGDSLSIMHVSLYHVVSLWVGVSVCIHIGVYSKFCTQYNHHLTA